MNGTSRFLIEKDNLGELIFLECLESVPEWETTFKYLRPADLNNFSQHTKRI